MQLLQVTIMYIDVDASSRNQLFKHEKLVCFQLISIT